MRKSFPLRCFLNAHSALAVVTQSLVVADPYEYSRAEGFEAMFSINLLVLKNVTEAGC